LEVNYRRDIGGEQGVQGVNLYQPHVEVIVVCDEGARRRAAGDHVHHLRWRSKVRHVKQV